MKSKVFIGTIFSITFFLLITVSYASSRIFVLFATIYRNNTVILHDFSISEGTPYSFPGFQANYTIKIISVENDILFRAPIEISFIAYPETLPEYPGVIELNETTIYLRLPYFPDADRIEMYYRNSLIFQHKILRKPICGDDFCDLEFGENYENCSEDCPPSPPTAIPIYIYLIIVLVFISLVIVFLIKIKRGY